MPDYIASILVFGILLGMFLSAWNSVISDQVRFTEEERMRTQAVHTSTFLVSTPGYPENWEDTGVDVEIPGFARPDHVLQQEKLEAFDSLDYREQRSLLQAPDFQLKIVRQGRSTDENTLGDGPVAYILPKGTQVSNTYLLKVLNNSEVRWDLYWPSDKDLDLLGSLTARHVYNYTTNAGFMFDNMTVNASNGAYNTMISEDTQLKPKDVAREPELEQFVKDGGTLLQTQHHPKLIKDVFGLDGYTPQTDKARVKRTLPLINSSFEKGDIVEFRNKIMAFENVDVEFANETQSPHRCLACMWSIGSGKVYYIQDGKAEAGFLSIFEEASNAFETIYLFGRSFKGADTVVPVSRNVQVNVSGSMKTAKLNYVVWR